ncbi:hypothetical protein F383_38633 [Gossypium arboreum]|uniref:Uncharacterized protein n=1 Tax=Gossypium arboreum TaxID=29729 RepID=A0A0B0MH82_GOSAR|nr:hypothetical protein F383_38633 [Gossypium arboreum]
MNVCLVSGKINRS